MTAGQPQPSAAAQLRAARTRLLGDRLSGSALRQALAVVSVIAYTFVMTMIIAFVVNLVIRMRVPAEVEDEGLDYALHGETAYEFSTLGGSPSIGAPPRAAPERAPAHREGVTT